MSAQIRFQLKISDLHCRNDLILPQKRSKLKRQMTNDHLYYIRLINCSTGTPHRIDVDSTSILRRYIKDQISANFQVIPTYFFDVILLIEKSTSSLRIFSTYFAGRKIQVNSTYFFRCNFDGQIIHVVSTYFFQCNSAGRKIHVASTYFLRCNFSSRNIHRAST